MASSDDSQSHVQFKAVFILKRVCFVLIMIYTQLRFNLVQFKSILDHFYTQFRFSFGLSLVILGRSAVVFYEAVLGVCFGFLNPKGCLSLVMSVILLCFKLWMCNILNNIFDMFIFMIFQSAHFIDLKVNSSVILHTVFLYAMLSMLP